MGVNSVDVEDQAAPLAGGGTFDVAIDAGTELVASASLGLRVRLGEGFLFEPAPSAQSAARPSACRFRAPGVRGVAGYSSSDSSRLCAASAGKA